VTPAGGACPVCGGQLVIPPTGRRPVYCGKACRQAAHRARLAAARAAERAAWIRRELAGDGTRPGGGLPGAPPAAGQRGGVEYDLGVAWLALFDAAARVRETPPGPGEVAGGWERDVARCADQVARLAHRAADLAAAHERAAAEFAAARAVLRRVDPDGPGGDETPAAAAGYVAGPAAARGATKPAGAAVAAVADRDALFDAVEDVVYLLDQARPDPVPDHVAAALETPASALAEILAGQDGNGPLGELTAAAAEVLAASPRRSELPGDVAAALDALARALPEPLPDPAPGAALSISIG